MRAREFSKWLHEQLIQVGVQEPEAESRMILEDLGISRLLLVTEANDPVSAGQVEHAKRILAEREQHVPLQYILGYQFFRKLQLTVNADVLIPRPETEELVQLALDRAPTGGRVLDLGTGSGAIAISLGLERTDLEVIATDISPQALVLARRNAKALGIRVEFLEGNGFEPVMAYAPLDMIVSNPPYVPQANLDSLTSEVKDHEPILALCPGDDALKFYRLFASEGARLLSPDGWLLAECEADLAQASADLFTQPDWKHVEIIQDMQGKDRFICAQRA